MKEDCYYLCFQDNFNSFDLKTKSKGMIEYAVSFIREYTKSLDAYAPDDMYFEEEDDQEQLLHYTLTTWVDLTPDSFNKIKNHISDFGFKYEVVEEKDWDNL